MNLPNQGLEHDPHPHHLTDPAQVLCVTDSWVILERMREVAATVVVRVESEVGRDALHHRERPALAAAIAALAAPARVEAEHGVDEDAAHAAHELTVVRDAQNPLPPQLNATSFCSGRIRAREQCEASREHAAIDVALELTAHEVGQGRREPLLDGCEEREQVVAHDQVQRALLGPPARVAPFWATRLRGKQRAHVRPEHAPCPLGLARFPAEFGTLAVAKRLAAGGGRHRRCLCAAAARSGRDAPRTLSARA